MPDWTSLSWLPHQFGLARWAAQRWGWKPTDPDWPSSLALLVSAEDEGHTAFDWHLAAQLWSRRFPDSLADSFSLPSPESWPQALFSEGWLHRRESSGVDLIQTARNAALEARLVVRLSELSGVSQERFSGSGQEAALVRAGQVRLLFLVGGPGTGKTTTLKRLVERWASAVPRLRTVIAAPTGRAAARVRQSFSDAPLVPDCLTLHRLLGLRPGLGQPWHGPHRPLPFDLVIVDEASMLDLRTAVGLTDALGPGTALVLVGDPGQLPSVEAGSVVSDLLRRPEFADSVVRLTQRFRLDEGSNTLARVFDLLQRPITDPAAVAEELRQLGDGRAADFRWQVTATAEDPGPQALALWGSVRQLTTQDLNHRILLSPVHRGPGGTEALGALADRALGRLPGTVAEGLPWMIRRNLPHLGLHNGDRGLVVGRDGRLWFETSDGHPWPFSLVSEDGQPAWAVTVHKSQGSEYDRVVLVLPPDSPTVIRELIYTGLTRAKTSATLVGSVASLVRALGQGADRQSGL